MYDGKLWTKLSTKFLVVLHWKLYFHNSRIRFSEISQSSTGTLETVIQQTNLFSFQNGGMLAVTRTHEICNALVWIEKIIWQFISLFNEWVSQTDAADNSWFVLALFKHVEDAENEQFAPEWLFGFCAVHMKQKVKKESTERVACYMRLKSIKCLSRTAI